MRVLLVVVLPFCCMALETDCWLLLLAVKSSGLHATPPAPQISAPDVDSTGSEGMVKAVQIQSQQTWSENPLGYPFSKEKGSHLILGSSLLGSFPSEEWGMFFPKM